MKKIIFVLTLLCTLFYSCKDKSANRSNPKDESAKNQSEYSDSYKSYKNLYNKAKESPVTETKLFGGFEIGMNEAQVDSVIKSMYDKGKLIYFLEINEDFGTIHDRDEFTIGNCAYEFSHESTPFYIEFTPKYLSGRLVGLFCIIIPDKDHKYSQPPHRIMADIFQASERGKTFKRVNLPLKGKKGEKVEIIYFIKDNLEVSFYPQEQQLKEGTMQYSNIPDMEAYWAEQRKKNDSSNEL